MTPLAPACRAAIFVVLLAVPAAMSGAPPADEFNQDLTGGQLTEGAFDLFGFEPQKSITREAAGLRIQLPAKKDVPQTGLIPRFRLSGDFEAVAYYEILRIDSPPGGYGTGVTILIDGGPKEGVAAIARLRHPKEGSAYAAYRGTPGKDGALAHHHEFSPTEATRGKLGLKREGAQLIYLVADGPAEPLREVHRRDFAAADAGMRIFADTGAAPAAVDARFTRLEFKAGRIGVGGEPASGFGWRTWLYSASAGLLLAAGVVWYARRRGAAEAGKEPRRAER